MPVTGKAICSTAGEIAPAVNMLDKALVQWKGFFLNDVCLYEVFLRHHFLAVLYLTRALMGSGELRVLMGVAQRAPPLRIFKGKSRRVKIQTALERSRRTLQDKIMLTFFFDL